MILFMDPTFNSILEMRNDEEMMGLSLRISNFWPRIRGENELDYSDNTKIEDT
jgi:hypothetical protein